MALARALSGLDDAALAALANPGLLKRARKEIERGAAVSEATVRQDGQVELTVEETRIVLDPSSPHTLTCSCRSREICRHGLIALVSLRDRFVSEPVASSVSPPPAPMVNPSREPEAILAVTLPMLEKWMGKRAVKEGFALSEDAKTEILEGSMPGVRFLETGIECRFPPGGLDEALVTAREGQREKYLVAGLLAYRRARGAPPFEPPKRTEESRDAPEERSRILERVQRLAERMIDVGIAHPSTSMVERWSTLSTSAWGAGLARLSRQLQSLSEETKAMVERRASAGSSKLLAELAQAYALAVALANNDDERLMGAARDDYLDKGTLELQGVGAFPWRSNQGFQGVTVVFWQPAQGKWWTWNDSRPVDQTSFNPLRRFEGVSPWEASVSVSRLAAAWLTLRHAKGSAAQRLSSSAQTRAEINVASFTSSRDWRELFIDDWNELRRRMTATRALGLQPERASDRFTLVYPARWGRRWFDPIRQELRWELWDTRGQRLDLRLPQSDLHDAGIDWLEALHPATLVNGALAGRVDMEAGSMTLFPFACWRPNQEGDWQCDSFLFAKRPKRSKRATSKLTKTPPAVPTNPDPQQPAVDSFELDESHERSSLPDNEPVSITWRLLTPLAERGTSALNDDMRHVLLGEADRLLKRRQRTLSRALHALHSSESGRGGWLLRAAYLARWSAEIEIRGKGSEPSATHRS